MASIGVVAKAVTAAVAAFAGAYGTAAADGTVTGEEWIGIAATVIVAAAAVWAVPNTVKPAEDGEV